MKRFLIGLLAVGLIAAFSMPVLAVDVKFSGEFKAEGWYESNRYLTGEGGGLNKSASQGLFDQRLRVNTIFKVSEGLSLVTRFDALTKIWGDPAVTDTWQRSYDTGRKLSENIEFERAYAEFKAAYGLFRVGYAPTGTFGTAFGDYDYTAGMVRYYYFNGPWTFFLSPERGAEGEFSAATSRQATLGNVSDDDYTYIQYGGTYKWATGDAGIAGVIYWDKRNRTSTTQPNQQVWQKYVPYVRAGFGPLYVEAEFIYVTGDKFAYESPATQGDVSLRGWSGYANAKYTIGPAYIGGQVSHVSGDDAGTQDKFEQGASSGREYKPTLILINPDRDYFMGGHGNAGAFPGGNTYGAYGAKVFGAGGATDNSMYGQAGGAVNYTLYQIYAGFKPIEKLELFGSWTYAKLDQKPPSFIDDKLGNEFDITATYKIYDNLTYMIGWGWLNAGDAWKGTNAAAQTDNDWLLMHRLTLNF